MHKIMNAPERQPCAAREFENERIWKFENAWKLQIIVKVGTAWVWCCQGCTWIALKAHYLRFLFCVLFRFLFWKNKKWHKFGCVVFPWNVVKITNKLFTLFVLHHGSYGVTDLPPSTQQSNIYKKSMSTMIFIYNTCILYKQRLYCNTNNYPPLLHPGTFTPRCYLST